MINSSDSPFKFKNEVARETCLSFLMKWQLVWETLIPRQCHGCLKSGQHLQLDKSFTRQKPINGYFTSKIVLFSFQKNRVWFLITYIISDKWIYRKTATLCTLWIFFLPWELLFNGVKKCQCLFYHCILLWNISRFEPFWDNIINLHLNDTICTDKISLPAFLTLSRVVTWM